MEEKIKALDIWGNSFWRRHLKIFGFIKYFCSQFIDFLSDQMHSPELSVMLSGIYIIGLNANLLGLYSAIAICQPLFPYYLKVPNELLLISKFSLYSHHFYPLLFVGNLKKSPLIITVVCALYAGYDFILLLVDVSTM